MNPTQEQIERFWEKLGFKHQSYLSSFGNINETKESWLWTDGVRVYTTNNYDGLPLIDLNNLFKYAIAKLGVCAQVEISWSPVKGYRDYTVDIVTWKPDTIAKHHKWTEHENLALALFWAIGEVIKESE